MKPTLINNHIAFQNCANVDIKVQPTFLAPAKEDALKTICLYLGHLAIAIPFRQSLNIARPFDR